MIKLLIPLNRGGKVIEAGTNINLPANLEEKLINAGNAEKYVPEEVAQEPDETFQELAKALDKKYNRDPLAEAAVKAEVTFEEDATKKVIIAAVIAQGKAEELLKEGE